MGEIISSLRGTALSGQASTRVVGHVPTLDRSDLRRGLSILELRESFGQIGILVPHPHVQLRFLYAHGLNLGDDWGVCFFQARLRGSHTRQARRLSQVPIARALHTTLLIVIVDAGNLLPRILSKHLARPCNASEAHRTHLSRLVSIVTSEGRLLVVDRVAFAVNRSIHV